MILTSMYVCGFVGWIVGMAVWCAREEETMEDAALRWIVFGLFAGVAWPFFFTVYTLCVVILYPIYKLVHRS